MTPDLEGLGVSQDRKQIGDVDERELVTPDLEGLGVNQDRKF